MKSAPKNTLTRRFILPLMGIGMLLGVGGCGFSPVYSQNGSGIGPVNIAPIEGRNGYFMEQELKKLASLEQKGPSPRDLKVKLNITFSNASLGLDSFTRRVRINYDVQYELAGSDSKNTLKGGFTDSVSFDGSTNSFSEVNLQADAEERASKLIAERIWRDILVKTNSAKPSIKP